MCNEKKEMTAKELGFEAYINLNSKAYEYNLEKKEGRYASDTTKLAFGIFSQGFNHLRLLQSRGEDFPVSRY